MLRVIDVIMFDKEILEILSDEVVALRRRRVEERHDKPFRPADLALLKYSRTLAWEIANRNEEFVKEHPEYDTMKQLKSANKPEKPVTEAIRPINLPKPPVSVPPEFAKKVDDIMRKHGIDPGNASGNGHPQEFNKPKAAATR